MQAVFFDMDGVLVDTEPLWREVSSRVFAAVGIVLDEAMHARCAGLDGEAGVRLVLDAHPRVRADAATLQQRIESTVLRELAVGARPMAGATALLAALRQRGVPLALVSTAPRPLIDQVLDGQGWRGYFALTLSSEEVGPGKPDPAVYREAMRRLAVAPGAGVAVEDTPAGATSARAAGLQVAAVQQDAHLRADLAPLADHLFYSLAEAGAWLLAETATRTGTGPHQKA